MPGKVGPTDLLEHVFTRTGRSDDAVRQGPAIGEDAAAIDVEAGTLVVSSDPISLAASAVGRIGVHVACNDVAASGGDPRWLTVVCLLAPDADLATITADLDATAREVGVAIVGGHTERVDALERPMLSLTALGPAERFVPTGGAEPGDVLVLTRGAAIEGSAILAADFGADLDVPPAVCERAEAYLEELSVIPAARILRSVATGMHDPTEGGVAGAALELARAAGTRVVLDREAVPVREPTRQLCAAAGVDPLRIFGSGALLATVPPEHVDGVLGDLEDAGIDAAAVGAVHEGDPALELDGKSHTDAVRDDLYSLWAAADAGE